jgi:hypothetical protein
MSINSQAKGKRAERDVANWFKVNGFPDAARAVKTGDQFTKDAGDLILEHGIFRLCVEVKHHAGGLTQGQVAEFGKKLMDQVKQSRAILGVLIERRDRVADAGQWWAHVPFRSFVTLVELGYDRGFTWNRPIRMTVDDFALRLREAGLVHDVSCMSCSAASAPDGLAPGAAMATTNGGT